MGMFGAQPKGDESMPISTKRRLSTAATAALVRKAVKTAHPGVKFSVRSKTYAGGASIDVSWTDGPTVPQVEATAKLYQGATFDGMTDSTHYHDSLLSTDDGAEVVSYGTDFVFCNRRLSAEFIGQLENELAALTGEPYDPRRAYHAVALATPGTDEPAKLCSSIHEKTWGTDLIHQLAWSRPQPAAQTHRL
jgi:Large polyvalent protein associated domain 29